MLNRRVLFLLALLLTSQLFNAVFGAVLTPGTVTGSSFGFRGIYVGSNEANQGLGKFLSEQGMGTFYLYRSVPAASEIM
jgi:hypothetical protein